MITNKIRDLKLLELKKRHLGIVPRHYFTRDQLNTMRDVLRALLRKELNIGKGRPKRARTMLKEGYLPHMSLREA